MDLLLCLFGFISGITTALFGFGGGFIAVPLLYALITLVWGPRHDTSEVAMQIAVATSTFVMIFSSSLSSRATLLKRKLELANYSALYDPYLNWWHFRSINRTLSRQ
ncbi:Sulfite exporter TauE/SafE [Providencia alcalifaciens]|nr:Sulfite exporter TauE/SafE [Providencia alcalifaciens]